MLGEKLQAFFCLDLNSMMKLRGRFSHHKTYRTIEPSTDETLIGSKRKEVY